MRIEQIIHELLLTHDCVSIPGFGGLVAQRFRAEINHGTHLLRPPSKRMSYHKDLVANSHLLLNKLSQSENINQAAASEQVAKAVETWQAILNKGESVKLEGIGRFYLDKESHICFNQSLESNFDLDSFGLDIFRATAIKRDSEVKEAVTVAIAENYKKSNKRFPFWRAAAVFAGIGALLTIGFFKSDVSLPSDLKANFNPLIFSKTVDEAQSVDSADDAEETSTSTTIHYDDVIIEEPTANVEPSLELKSDPVDVQREPANFEVVVGSFKDISNADDLLHDLKEQGYKPTIIEDGSAFTKVSIEGFSQRSQAVQAMRAYKLSVNRGAWIYKR